MIRIAMENSQRLRRLETQAEALERQLETEYACKDGILHLYHAGLRRNQVRFGLFGRDLLITSMLLRRTGLTRDVLLFIADTLGTRDDARSGEEIGRGIHELARVEMRGMATHYDAIDTTPLFLIAAYEYLVATNDEELAEKLSRSLALAVRFMEAHLVEGLFVEDPAYAGATGYALRATYWKDSQLPGRIDPAYPVTYSLVQAQAVAAFRSAAKIAQTYPHITSTLSEDLEALAIRALDGLFKQMWDTNLDIPLVARDQQGPISGISSDMLHMLAYIEPGDIDSQHLDAIEQASRQLTTPYGFRTLTPNHRFYDAHAYHLGAIWPFEQALIARGAKRHALPGVAETAYRVIDVLESEGFPELVYWSGKSAIEGALAVEGQGCDLQLWTLAVPAALRSLEEAG